MHIFVNGPFLFNVVRQQQHFTLPNLELFPNDEDLHHNDDNHFFFPAFVESLKRDPQSWKFVV